MTIRELLATYHLTQAAFSQRFGIPIRTVEDWCRGVRTPPPYVPLLIEDELKRYEKGGTE